MTRRILLVLSVVSVLLFALINFVYAQEAGPQAVDAPQAAVGTAFTYQGQLKSGGVGLTGSCEMTFRLYDAVTVGHPVGVPLTQTVAVNAGLFTTQLDFGASAFSGQARWLEIAVKCPGDAVFTPLSRQALTPAPYANYAPSAGSAPWSGLTGIPAGFADGVDNVSIVVSGTNIYAGDGLDELTNGNNITLSIGASYRLPQACGIGQIPAWKLGFPSYWACADDQGSTDHWGASWSGAGTGLTLSGGIIGLSGSGSSYGVQGQTSGTTGYQAGVRGETASTGGWGVAGVATASSGTTFGVGGVSDSTAGTGVYGSASAATGTTYGVYGHVSSPAGWAAYFTSVGNGVYINAPPGKVGLNVAGGGTAQVDGNTIWHAGNDGPASGLSADLLDGQHGNYYLDVSNIQAGTLSTGNYSAYADLSAEGYLGNASGDLALNNGTLNTNLNADLLDGQSASAFAASTHSHDHGALTGLTDDDHTQYFNLSQSETVTGIPAFNGGATSLAAPFTVDSNYLVTHLNADLLDGQHASAFADSTHNHWGASWTGAGTGLTLSGGTTGLSGSGSSYGVLGQTSGASSYRVGVRGETTSTGGWGVAGVATAASGTTYGVGGVSDSSAGTGVYGSASAASGTTYGVYGTAASPLGVGVYGTAASPLGVGVYGIATATSFESTGVYGKSNSTSGFGGHFESAGIGVYVESADTGVFVAAGTNDGMHVASAGSDGIDAVGNLYAGYFRGNINVTGTCTGCALAVFGINASDRSIQPGEVVAIQGVQASTLDNAQSLWKVTPATGNGAVVGVVRGRAELDVAKESQELRMGETGERLVPRSGEVKPGEYLTIVIYGPMQVRAGTSGTIAAGTRLTVGENGLARPLQTVVVNGVTLAESAALVGTALDAVDKNGLVWVLVNPR